MVRIGKKKHALTSTLGNPKIIDRQIFRRNKEILVRWFEIRLIRSQLYLSSYTTSNKPNTKRRHHLQLNKQMLGYLEMSLTEEIQGFYRKKITHLQSDTKREM